tara:strand:- start:490 stop:714 length:225 start_codon:yes stop_codon:yes gene_type:complete
MFKAPAAPAPIATESNEIVAVKKLTVLGAINKPTTQVKITSDITRGFINLNKLFKYEKEYIFVELIYCKIISLN